MNMLIYKVKVVYNFNIDDNIKPELLDDYIENLVLKESNKITSCKLKSISGKPIEWFSLRQ